MKLNANVVFNKTLLCGLGLDKYSYLLENKDKITLSHAHDYARIFNSYFKVRKNYRWQELFFDFFEVNKNNTSISFKEVIEGLYLRERTYEASYASKMLAIINPEKPIWDQYVLKYYNLKAPHGKAKERMENIIRTYKDIERKTKQELKKETVQNQLKIFDQWLPEFKNISSVKKLDTMIWKTRN